MLRPSIFLLLTVALAAVLLLPGPAPAAPAAESPDPVAFYADTAIWTIVVFGLLFVVLRYVTLPGMPKPAFVMMLEGLRRREEAIQGALDEARKAREDAQVLRGQLQEEMNQAQEKVRALMDEARRDGEKLKADLAAEGHKAIQAEKDRVHREMELEKDKALQYLWNQTAQLATLVSSKAIRRQLSPDDHRALVEEALAELGQAKPDGAVGG
jgi:F-type H+-transporting ATPase subunit b